jgi:division protein CdvB (Snf7/Vps24/ESCRT-III family)
MLLEEFAKNKLKTAAVNGQNVQNVAAEVNDELLKKGIKKIIEEQAPELLELKPPEEGL